MSHSFQRPSEPGYYIEDCRILTNGGQQLWCCKQWLKFSKEIDQGATILSLTRFSKTKGWNHFWINYVYCKYIQSPKTFTFSKSCSQDISRTKWLTCACQIQSAIHYIRGLLLELPLKILNFWELYVAPIATKEKDEYYTVLCFAFSAKLWDIRIFFSMDD